MGRMPVSSDECETTVGQLQKGPRLILPGDLARQVGFVPFNRFRDAIYLNGDMDQGS